MSAFKVLTVGVSLVFGLQAMDGPTDNRAADVSAAKGSQSVAATQVDGRALMRQHNYAGAVRLFEQCLAGTETPSERVISLAWYGIGLHRLGRNKEARPALERALTEWTDTPETPNEERIGTSSILSSVDRYLGDYQSAERVLRTAAGEPSVKDEQRAMLMVSLADLLREEAHVAEAEMVLNEARQLAGLSMHQRTDVLIESAELALDMHSWSASVSLWNKVGEIARVGDSAQLQGIVAGGLAETWFAAGNLQRAEPLFRRSLQLLREDPGTTASQLAAAMSSMVRLYLNENKLALAEETLDEAIKIDGDALGPDHPQTAMLFELRAMILSRRGEVQSARDDLERARIIMIGHFGPDSAGVAGVLAALGDVEQRANRPEAAIPDYEQALQLMREAGADTLRLGSGIVQRYAAALKAAHRSDEARALVRAFQASQAPASTQQNARAISDGKSFRGN